MRRDDLYLAEIVESCRHIRSFLDGVPLATWAESELLRSAVLQKLTVIGEAATGVSGGLQVRHPAVPWRRIRAFRNTAVHEYFAIEWQTVWDIATTNVPDLEADVLDLLKVEFPDTAGRLMRQMR